MSRTRRFRLNAVDCDQQALLATAADRPWFKLMAKSWLDMAEREDGLLRLTEPRSFAPEPPRTRIGDADPPGATLQHPAASR